MKVLFIIALIAFSACSDLNDKTEAPTIEDSSFPETSTPDNTRSDPTLLPPVSGVIETGMITPEELIIYARTLIGTRYLYASTDPAKGFDCSGFITHVFNHFNIAVPRSSFDFTNVGKEIDSSDARPGDLILFTGTDSTIRVVGHMGIVISNNREKIEFIHSSSGKANGVVITPFEKYYRSRFVKVIRVFPET